MTFDDPEERSGIAGEYVLGTLDAAEHEAVTRELATNEALAFDVAQWQDRLLGLSARSRPAVPSDHLWQRIDAALPAQTPLREVARDALPGSSPAQAPDATATRPSPPASSVRGDVRGAAANDSFWNRVGVWKSLSGLAVAACLAMVVLFAVQRQGAVTDRYVAVLQSPDKLPGWIVETSTNAPLRLIPLTPDSRVPEGKSLQFWTKLDGAAGPTSLGIVRNGQRIEIELAKLPGVAGNQLFEITLEPPNGSPLNKPTGPVLFIGRSVKV